jgi:hypothetical protein
MEGLSRMEPVGGERFRERVARKNVNKGNAGSSKRGASRSSDIIEGIGARRGSIFLYSVSEKLKRMRKGGNAGYAVAIMK